MKKSISIFIVLVLLLSVYSVAYATEPQYKSTKALIELLEEYGIKYSIQKVEFNDEMVNFVDEGDYRKELDIDVAFYDTEDEMTLYSFDVIKFSDRDYRDVLEAVNQLNCTKNYACFYVAEDGVNASWDVYLGETEAKNIIDQTVSDFLSTVDEAYHELSKFEKN